MKSEIDKPRERNDMKNLRSIGISKRDGLGTVKKIDNKEINVKKTLILLLLVVISWSFIPFNQRQADAAIVTVDVCQWIIEEVFIPPTYQDIVTCDNDWYLCAFIDPSCCIPFVCNSLPHCIITQTVVDVAGHWGDQPKWECHPEDLDPAEEFEKWLRQQIPSLDDLLLPGAFDAAKLDIEAMRLASTRIPRKVKDQVFGLIEPFSSAGTAKFSSAEIGGAKIISNSNRNASLYLRDGFGAITLDDLIIIRNTSYEVLMDSSHHDYTVSQITSGGAPSTYVEALLLLIHELVHVKQYSSLGLDAFLTNYLIETISRGYGSDSFEKGAYEFELVVAQTIRGNQDAERAVATATATALGVSAQAVVADEARWMEVAKWVKSCLRGGARRHGVFPPRPIEKKDCAPTAMQRFGIDRDRSSYPLEKSTRLPVEELITPEGKKVIIPPQPITSEGKKVIIPLQPTAPRSGGGGVPVIP